MIFDEFSLDYDNSELRLNLNNSFFDLAFTEEEKAEMLHIYKNDFITIPSSVFLQSNVNGFPHSTENSYTRMRRVTDFSKCIGIYEPNYIFSHNGCSYWWVRNSSIKENVMIVKDNGRIGYGEPNKNAVGICPIIKIKKSDSQKILNTFNELESIDDYTFQLIAQEVV